MAVHATFASTLWRYPGQGGWHFVTVPPEIADDVRARVARPAGFGSIRVTVTVGTTTWSTSLFPDAASGSYLLPIRADVRRANGIAIGDDVPVTISIAEE